MVGLRKQLPSYWRSQSSFHFDLEALPSWSLRVDDDAVHKRSEIVDQGTAVVLCASHYGSSTGTMVTRGDSRTALIWCGGWERY